jgi:hypothetical protein
MSKYSTCSTLGIGCPIWSDIKRTSLYRGSFLSDGTTYYRTNADGVIYETAACPTPFTQFATTFYPYPGYIYKSTDYGSTWNVALQTTGDYSDLAVSSTGTYITVTQRSSSTLLVSSNGGASSYNFVGVSGLNSPTSVAMSADGQYQLIGDLGGAGTYGWIYRSTNYGASWTQLGNSPGYKAWYGVAISSTGQFQTVVGDINTGRIVISNNYGASWNNKNTGRWRSIAMSADGRYQLAGSYLDYLFLSSNYGSTFNAVIFPWTALWGYGNTYTWPSVAVSSTGQYMLAVNEYGGIWLSQNYGSTWTNQTGDGKNWSSCSMYPSGEIMFAAETNGSIWRSSNYGGNWEVVPNTGTRNYSSLTSTTILNGCPSPGTLIDEYCNGYDFQHIYADGNCGTYETTDYNSTYCGFSYSYTCDCGYGCEAYASPCYYYGCYNCDYV